MFGGLSLHHRAVFAAAATALLGSFAPATTVCWCNAVTVERIETSASCGVTTVEGVGKDTRAGTGCGGCKGRIAEVLARYADNDEATKLAG